MVKISFEETSGYIFLSVKIIDGLIWNSFYANLIFIYDLKILWFKNYIFIFICDFKENFKIKLQSLC